MLCNANDVIREDGSKVILMKNPSWETEIIGLKDTLVKDPLVALLFPMFFASNIFYTYQTNDMNAAFFNTRTRSLNNVLYWAAQIFGAVLFGYALDFGTIRRSVRARASFAVLFLLTFVVWGGGYAWEKQQLPRELATTANPDFKTVDWTDGGKKYIGPMFLYIFFGFYDACWQTCIYWYMGALSNSGRKAANLAGFYKGIQSAGAAIFWRMDDVKVSFTAMYGSTVRFQSWPFPRMTPYPVLTSTQWGVLAGSLLIAAPLIMTRIKDTVSIEEDLKFSDETIEDVVAPSAVQGKVVADV